MSKTNYDLAGIFMIVLILSMPFYSANGLAAVVKIEHNSGRDNFNGYLNGKGDVWTVQATVTNLETDTLSPNDLSLVLGGRGDEFDFCNSNNLGFTCEYISDVSTGVPEDSYTFEVKHLPTNAGDGDTIVADSSAPEITGVTVEQRNDGKVHLNFKAADKPNFGVGLSKIEILDADTQQVLQEISFAERRVEFNYAADYGTDGIFIPSNPAYLTGQGDKFLKIRATDKFGHQKTKGPFRFKTDFVKPVIFGDAFTLVGLTDFMGSSSAVSRLVINVTETNELKKLTATSGQIEFAANDIDPATSCVLHNEETIGDYYTCTWTPIRVLPSSSVSIQFKIEDKVGNILDQTLSKSFVVDTSAPEVEFFGTKKLYREDSYINDEKTLIVLKVKESGAGMALDGSGILADFSQIVSGGSSVSPDSCEQSLETFNCNFTINNPSVSGAIETINLIKLTDNVGNEGSHISTDLIVDTAAPHVNRLEFLGLSRDREKEYYESGDKLVFRMNITEVKSGLFFKVDLNDVVMGAESVYPATDFSEEGWQVFTEESCEQNGEDWICEFLTEAELKSGHQSAARIEVVLEDTAGNKIAFSEENWNNVLKKGSAEPRDNGVFIFEKLAVEDEASPDYWESESVNLMSSFVNLDTVQLFPTRVIFEAGLRSEGTSPRAIDIELVKCESADSSTSGPELSRALLYGGVSAEGDSLPKVNIVLEFKPFDPYTVFDLEFTKEFEKVSKQYTCELRIFSKVSGKALSSAEFQDIIVEIPFGFSELGALDENLEGKIKEIKEEALFKTLNDIKFLGDILKYISYFVDLLVTIIGIYTIVNIFQAEGDALRTIPVVGALSAIGLCELTEVGKKPLLELPSILQIPIALFSCNPGSSLGWYGSYQRSVLEVYNIISLRGILGVPATSLKENIYTSMLGACVPGIIENLMEYRQVRCREILCLEQEVPAGLATVESCKDLGEYLHCRFWLGPAISFTPLGGLDTLLKVIASIATNAFGWIRALAVIIPCSAACAGSSTGTAACSYIGGTVKIIDLVDTAIGAYKNWPGTVGDPYCSQLEEEEEPVEDAEETAPEGNENI